jgi:phosphoenolpyruvate-protein kinase (PTS system EI component)
MARLTVCAIGASPGIGEGRAYLFALDAAHRARSLDAPLAEGVRWAETERWRRALDAAAAQLAALQARIGDQVGEDEAAVFEVQALSL